MIIQAYRNPSFFIVPPYLLVNAEVGGETLIWGSIDIALSCGNYLWQSNLLISSGIDTNSITNAAECDSNMTLNLTINQATASSETTDVGDSYFWQGTTYSNSGTYVDTIVNAVGCDGVLTLNLTVTNLDTALTFTGGVLTSHQVGALYQWLDCEQNMPIAGANGSSFSPSVTGNYAVVVSLNGCQDTSACKTVTLVGRDLALADEIGLYTKPSASQFTIPLPQRFPPAFD